MHLNEGILSSRYMDNLMTLAKSAKYETTEELSDPNRPTKREIEGVLRMIGNWPVTLYDRIGLGPTAFAVPGGGPLEDGQIVTPIQCITRPATGSPEEEILPFWFAYKNYTKRLEEYQDKIKRNCLELAKRDEFRVRFMEQLSIGSLLGLKSKFADSYARVRVTKMDLLNEQIHYWAVDEAFDGVCGVRDLIFLNDACVTLEMLAVPGIMALGNKDLTPAQLKTVESGKYRLGRVKQPILADDYAPRIVQYS